MQNPLNNTANDINSRRFMPDWFDVMPHMQLRAGLPIAFAMNGELCRALIISQSVENNRLSVRCIVKGTEEVFTINWVNSDQFDVRIDLDTFEGRAHCLRELHTYAPEPEGGWSPSHLVGFNSIAGRINLAKWLRDAFA
jgi:hypothetical protein